MSHGSHSRLSSDQTSFNVRSQEQYKCKAVKHRVEDPSSHSVASTLLEMQKQNADVGGGVAEQEDEVAVHHERESGRAESHVGAEPVGVDDGEPEGGEENREDLKRLREFEPEERHADEDGVVEEVEEREAAPPKHGEVGAEDVEEAGEVERVRPEEHAAGRPRPDRKTQQPL